MRNYQEREKRVVNTRFHLLMKIKPTFDVVQVKSKVARKIKSCFSPPRKHLPSFERLDV